VFPMELVFCFSSFIRFSFPLAETHKRQVFLYFLDKNKALFVDGEKKIEDATLVALTIMIAESRPEEKEMMISVIMNCML